MPETHQVPIETINPNQLPQEQPIKYDDICMIVGQLYLELSRRTKMSQDQMDALEANYKARIADLMQENYSLRQELQSGQQKKRPIPNNGGDSSVPVG